MVDLGTNVTYIIAGGLGNFTHIINILYFIFKKLAMLCLEVICYYFGIMHLLNQETEDVQQFLTRVAQGVIGMLLFPYFLEFLLDVDGVISMSILRLAGDTTKAIAQDSTKIQNPLLASLTVGKIVNILNPGIVC